MHDSRLDAGGATEGRDRAAEWLLSRIMPSSRAAAVVGDLSEFGAARSRVWFWATVLRIGTAATRDSLLSLMELPMTETRVPFVTFLGRRWRLLAASMVAAVAVVNLVISLAPTRYRSEAVILLGLRPEQRTPTRADTFTTATQQALAADRLSAIITEFDLYPDARLRGDMSGAIDAFRRDIQLSFLHRSVVAVRFRDEQPRRAQQITGRLAALLIDSIEPRNNEFHLASLSSATKGAEKLVVSGEVRVSGPTFEVAAGSITLDRGMVLENVDLKQVAAVLQDGERSSELLEPASLPEHPLERPRGMPSIFGALGGLAISVVGSGVAWRRSRHRRTGDAEADR